MKRYQYIIIPLAVFVIFTVLCFLPELFGQPITPPRGLAYNITTGSGAVALSSGASVTNYNLTGNVGINTNSASTFAALDVQNPSANANQQIIMRNDGASHHNGILFSIVNANAFADNKAWGVYGGPNATLTGATDASGWINGTSVPKWVLRWTASNLNTGSGTNYIEVIPGVGGTFGVITINGNLVVTNVITEPVLRAALVSDATTTSATLANLGLTATLTAGKTYEFTAILFLSDSTSADGAKVDFNGGTATMTDFRCQFTSFDSALNLSTQATALSTVATMTTFTGSGMVEVHGAVIVNAGGTFIPRFAQNAHTTGTLTCFKGSNIIFRAIN